MDTIIDRIIDQIHTALEGITTVNGYQIDVNAVYESTTVAGYGRAPQKTYTVELIQDDEVRNDAWSAPGNPPLVAWDVPIEMSLIVRASDKNTVPLRKLLNTFWADVQKALMIDPQWSNLALDTNIGDPQNFANENDGFLGKVALTTVTYRHFENDPYNNETTV